VDTAGIALYGSAASLSRAIRGLCPVGRACALSLASHAPSLARVCHRPTLTKDTLRVTIGLAADRSVDGAAKLRLVGE